MTRKDIFYRLQPCTEDDFRNDFEKDYFKLSKKNHYYQCIQDERVHLKGTRDSAYKFEDHAYIIFSVQKCNKDIRLTYPYDPKCDLEKGQCKPFDPPCESDAEIVKWLKNKKAMLRIL